MAIGELSREELIARISRLVRERDAKASVGLLSPSMHFPEGVETVITYPTKGGEKDINTLDDSELGEALREIVEAHTHGYW